MRPYVVFFMHIAYKTIRKGEIYMSEFDQKKYIAQYNKENYTEIKFRVKKGEKEIIEEHWKALGYKSLNEFINDLIKQDMEENSK